MTPLLALQHITKEFPGVRALDDVSFDLYEGEVHALVGENGAGKTTLMNVLSGVIQPDGGAIFLHGVETLLRSPNDAALQGIVYVHQELNLLDNLSVKENLFLGRLARTRLGTVAWGMMARKAEEILGALDLHVDPHQLVGELSVAERQMVEIARALLFESRIVVLDEPTSSLTDKETKRLFDLVRQLKERGRGIVYISHRLEEIFSVADHVTVLRNGSVVGTANVSEIQANELVRMMVGREVTESRRAPGRRAGDVLLRAEDLSGPRLLRDVSLDLRAGEIVGLAGLVGSGRTELLEVLAGARPARDGTIYCEGRQVRFRSPREALRNGVAYVPEDRAGKGLFLNFSIRRNVQISRMERLSRLGRAPRESEVGLQGLLQSLRVATPSLEQRTLNLSGGNRQKVVLAKCLHAGVRVLLVNEPTRGIDVGARAEIYQLLRQLTEEGLGILFASSDLLELLQISDRIVVLHEGRVVSTFSEPPFSKERVLGGMFGRIDGQATMNGLRSAR